MVKIVNYNSRHVEGLVPLLRRFEMEISGSDSVLAEAKVDMTLSELESGRDEALLAIESDGVVGFQVGCLYNNDADRFRKAGTFEFSMSYVNPYFRRKGMGRNLKSSFINSLKARPEVSSIVGCIYERNHASISLHKSLGFRRVGEYNDGARRYLVFRKLL